MTYSKRRRFEWDHRKNWINEEKHGLNFLEARGLFLSSILLLEYPDVLHSDFEDRTISIGPISRGIITVVWTERAEMLVRLISARFAKRSEKFAYFRHVELNR